MRLTVETFLGEISQAVFWYQLALKDRPEYHPNAFIEADYYDFIPLIQLCVCYDRMGNYDKALYYHKETKKSARILRRF